MIPVTQGLEGEVSITKTPVLTSFRCTKGKQSLSRVVEQTIATNKHLNCRKFKPFK